MAELLQPDFIQIPTQLLADKKLQSSDRILYGYIYWMTKLALLKCVASNEYIANLTGFSAKTIQNSLCRLEQQGYVRRIYADKGHKNRLEIVCLIAFSSVPPNGDTPIPKNGTQVSSNEDHNKNIEKEDINRNNSTNVLLAKTPNTDINDCFAYWQEKLGYAIQAKTKANRFACSNLLKRHGVSGVQRLIDGVVMAQGDQYAPRISDFCDMQSKFNQLVAWGRTKTKKTVGRVHVL